MMTNNWIVKPQTIKNICKQSGVTFNQFDNFVFQLPDIDINATKSLEQRWNKMNRNISIEVILTKIKDYLKTIHI